MKRPSTLVVLCLLIISTACGQTKPFPDPVGYVNDFDRIFNAQERTSLDSMVKAFEKESTVEISIVTIDSSWCRPEGFDSLAMAVHNQWGIGKKDKDNGVLILICRAYRKIRINTGYGIESRMTNAEAKRIIEEEIVPEFREGKFYEGTRKGLIAVMQELR
jgi:uncharacterized protein